MEAETQSVLLIIWVLFWMLSLSLVMVHPMFRPTRIQMRRSLRMHMERWRIANAKLQGHLRIRLGKSLLWLARRLEHREETPLWVRVAIKQIYNLIFMAVFWYLVLRHGEPLNWTYVVGFFVTNWTMDGVKAWWKRRKQRLQQSSPGANTPIKSVRE